MEEHIKKYFEQIEENLNRHLSNPDFPIDEKEKLIIRLELINELKPIVSWQFKNTESKQVSRIQWLASMRRSDALPYFILKQELAINIYDQIKLTLPYIEALNPILNKPIVTFVKNICDKIDLSGYSYDKDFPSDEEIKTAFKSFFEIVKPGQGNGNMFRECYEKIEHLYQEFLKLNKAV